MAGGTVLSFSPEMINSGPRAELASRGVDLDDPDEQVTADEWLAAHRAEQDRRIARRLGSRARRRGWPWGLIAGLAAGLGAGLVGQPEAAERLSLHFGYVRELDAVAAGLLRVR
jgi:hypothetical protein